MTALPPRATRVLDTAGNAPVDTVRLDYAARLLRRKRLVGQGGLEFLVDLEQVTSLDHGAGLCLEDGRIVAVAAADEPLVAITGQALPRLAWHIGNRHTPCEIHSDRLVIQRDPVIERMLTGLGADLRPFMGPFRPEGGAYGHGRTMGHSHGEHVHG
ncbi:urease accessory protein UreE [Palleronia pelagia]|uniref:Urease accessory protein UreE n=1 Tax=Palleronia pelagia TaxID=387096 RepID=A0A1H8JNS7_9RHOB|nr:urease accessory protein UreE [Palleronia pelagia]SEN82342.1 urease accessory protein [Palleronia pelagia]